MVSRRAIPEDEIELGFVRASGPGGQNVNKVSSKVQLRWNVGTSRAFTDAEKSAIRRYAGKRLNGRDEIVLSSAHERSQSQNRGDAIRRLEDILTAALAPKKQRKPTRVGAAQKRKRREEKRRISEKKRQRRLPQDE